MKNIIDNHRDEATRLSYAIILNAIDGYASEEPVTVYQSFGGEVWEVRFGRLQGRKFNTQRYSARRLGDQPEYVSGMITVESDGFTAVPTVYRKHGL